MAVGDIKSLTGNLLIVGEGNRDAEFFTALCARHALSALFQISCVQGNSTFDSLQKIAILPGYDSLPGILIFGDNDEGAGKSFRTIKAQLNNTDLPSPPRPLQIARKANHPPVAIAMMPFPDVNGSSEGCLETLLLPAIARAHPNEKACVDALYACAKIDRWATKSSRDKLQVRCILSSSCESNPMCGVNEWYRSSSNLIPMDDPIFNGLVKFLQGVPAWFSSGESDWSVWLAADSQ